MIRLNTATFTTPGTTAWVCPAGVTSVIILGQGGGGGGGGGGTFSSIAALNGRNGGTGGLATFLVPRIVPVTPGQSYNVTIGAGGAGGSSSTPFRNGVDGGTTTFGIGFIPTLEFLGASGGTAGNLRNDPPGWGPIIKGGYIPAPNGRQTSVTTLNLPISILAGVPGVTPSFIGNFGTYSGTPAAMGTNGPSGGGGAGTPGNSSDAGQGGVGGNGSNGAGGQVGGNAPSTSYGAGGGGGGGGESNPLPPGNGGSGAGGRLIIMWAE